MCGSLSLLSYLWDLKEEINVGDVSNSLFEVAEYREKVFVGRGGFITIILLGGDI